MELTRSDFGMYKDIFNSYHLLPWLVSFTYFFKAMHEHGLVQYQSELNVRLVVQVRLDKK